MDIFVNPNGHTEIEGVAPCPFCGSTVVEIWGPENSWIHCHGCGLVMEHEGPRWKAIRKWNKRVESGADDCPWCGEKAVVQYNSCAAWGTFSAGCNNCRVFQNCWKGYGPEKAIEVWRSRV